MDRHIKEVLGQYVKQAKISSGYQSERIEKIWQKKMGESVSKQTKYIRLNKSELQIKINSSVLKFELFQHVERIKSFLNEELKGEIIESVKFM
tara:strand:- start:335 stop:613 length:279 start_codon:yes stop_codon:yes gene_type:complete